MDPNTKVANILMMMHRMFVYIRSNVTEPVSPKILTIMLDCIQKLQHGNELELDQIRIEVFALDTSSKEFFRNALSFNEHNTTDNIDNVVKFIPVIEVSLKQILMEIENKQYNKAYALIDCIHCLPEMLIIKSKWSESEFWKHFVYPYRKNWDKSYLVEIERKIR